MKCSFKECDRPARAKGLCGGHYQQHRRGQPLRRLYGRYGNKKICSGCKKDKPLSEYYRRGKSGLLFSECKGCAKERSLAYYHKKEKQNG